MRSWMSTSAAWVSVGCMVGAAGVAPATAGPAIGQFEVKDLETEPGSIEFQSQNAHAFGQPRRAVVPDPDNPGELLFDDNSVSKRRHALELEFGITSFFRTRVGIEYESERVEDPTGFGDAEAFTDLRLEEIAVEGVVTFIKVPEAGGVGVGMLAEYEHPTENSEQRSLTFGPIIHATQGPWTAVANLTLVHDFGGAADERDEKWDFTYAAVLAYEVSDTWTLAMEAYGSVHRLGETGTRSEESELFGDFDQHRLGPIVYYTFEAGPKPDLPRFGQGRGAAQGLADADGDDDENIEVAIGVGLFFGLTDNTPDHTLKWSVEVDF